MNREIKFRGIRIDNGEIVVGSLILKYGKSYICYKASVKKTIGRKDIWCETEVAPESVGQFTGLHDKNGVEIYEGDVVKWCYSKHYWEAVISTIPNNKTNTLYAVETYHNCTTDETEEINTFERSDSRKGVRNELEYLSKDIEIIGNVYQNQELIK